VHLRHLLLVASCFCCSPPFFFRSYTPRFYHPPYLFRFDKFSSFLRGTFGAPHLLIKKRKKETTKERVKARCRITKKKQKKESERRQSEIGVPPYLVRPSFLIQHRYFLESKTIQSCAPSFPAGDLVPPLHLCTPTFHAPLPFSVRFHLVPAAFSTCLHPYSTLHLLIDCANPCSKVKSSYSSTNTYSVQVVSSGNRSIQASLVAPLVVGHPCWRGKNE
jgi:hypothetical protein